MGKRKEISLEFMKEVMGEISRETVEEVVRILEESRRRRVCYYGC